MASFDLSSTSRKIYLGKMFCQLVYRTQFQKEHPSLTCSPMVMSTISLSPMSLDLSLLNADLPRLTSVSWVTSLTARPALSGDMMPLKVASS